MAKHPSPAPEVELHFILPVISGLRKLGTVIAKQGDASVMHEFEYTDANDLTAAIIRVTRDLTERKHQVQATAAGAKAASKPASASASVPRDNAETEAENSSEDTASNPVAEDPSDNDLLTIISGTTAVHSNDALDATSVTDKRGQLSFT
jgi:microcystin degradation protein MlrC